MGYISQLATDTVITVLLSLTVLSALVFLIFWRIHSSAKILFDEALTGETAESSSEQPKLFMLPNTYNYNTSTSPESWIVNIGDEVYSVNDEKWYTVHEVVVIRDDVLALIYSSNGYGYVHTYDLWTKSKIRDMQALRVKMVNV